ncbi:hypothetical protein G6F65_013941 [Rhizopus arrhizus]|nr:hypothetical protein G6F65_013941 [Rhizopus arrhizus]
MPTNRCWRPPGAQTSSCRTSAPSAAAAPAASSWPQAPLCAGLPGAARKRPVHQRGQQPAGVSRTAPPAGHRAAHRSGYRRHRSSDAGAAGCRAGLRAGSVHERAAARWRDTQLFHGVGIGWPAGGFPCAAHSGRPLYRPLAGAGASRRGAHDRSAAGRIQLSRRRLAPAHHDGDRHRHRADQGDPGILAG